MKELNVQEISEVSGGVNAGGVFVGVLAGIAGTALTFAGLGTPITIAGAVLAFEGATMVAVSLTN